MNPTQSRTRGWTRGSLLGLLVGSLTLGFLALAGYYVFARSMGERDRIHTAVEVAREVVEQRVFVERFGPDTARDAVREANVELERMFRKGMIKVPVRAEPVAGDSAGSMQLRCAGADARFDTGDDIVVRVTAGQD